MPVTLVCQYAPCSKLFVVERHRKNTALYCTRECKHLATRLAEVIDLCQHCGQSYIVKRGARFCSPPCRRSAAGATRSGSGLQRFWARVQQCPHGRDCIYCCWPWMGTLDLNGYGHIQVHNKLLYTHRVAWELHNNQPLPDGMKAAHYCHRPACCQPMHIHAGTQKDNLYDSIRDGRHSFGERNGRSKLTEEQVIEAVTLRAAGWSFRKIASHLNVTHANIEAIWHGKTWRRLFDNLLS